MASVLNPYINFDGQAREALEFYKEVFGGEYAVNTYGELAGAQGADAEKIMHGQLKTGSGFTIMVADVPPGMPFTPGNTMSVSLSGDDRDDLMGYWTKLAEGATVTVAMEKQLWGDEFGMCVDRFGVNWLVNITGS